MARHWAGPTRHRLINLVLPSRDDRNSHFTVSLAGAPAVFSLDHKVCIVLVQFNPPVFWRTNHGVHLGTTLIMVLREVVKAGLLCARLSPVLCFHRLL